MPQKNRILAPVSAVSLSLCLVPASAFGLDSTSTAKADQANSAQAPSSQLVKPEPLSQPQREFRSLGQFLQQGKTPKEWPVQDVAGAAKCSDGGEGERATPFDVLPTELMREIEARYTRLRDPEIWEHMQQHRYDRLLARFGENCVFSRSGLHYHY